MTHANQNSVGAEPRCEGKGGPLLEQAIQRSLRAGGSASVVDPLLSLLVDLHRLKEQVLDTLSLLGVDVANLPPPYCPSHTPKNSFSSCSGAQQGEPTTSLRAAPAPLARSPTAASPPSAEDPSPPAREHPKTATHNVLATYCEQAASATEMQRREGTSSSVVHLPDSVSPQRQSAAVEGVLRWLDDHFPPLSQDAVAEPHDAARQLLASWLTCSISGSGTPVLVAAVDSGKQTDSDTSPSSSSAAHAHRKRRRDDDESEGGVSLIASPAPPPGKVASGVRSEGAYSSSELEQMVRVWSEYKHGLAVASHEAGALLHALCTPNLGASLSTHAKWIEMTSADRKRPFQLPSCAALTANYEEILSLHDCLATCQRPVRETFVALEAHVETLCDEALVVSERDHQFWQNVRCFQAEYAALHAMRAHTARIITSVKPITQAVQQ